MLIDFAYTSEIHINEMNVSYLLPAATMFQMQHVVEACCTFLENQLDPSNCIGNYACVMSHLRFVCFQFEFEFRRPHIYANFYVFYLSPRNF